MGLYNWMSRLFETKYIVRSVVDNKTLNIIYQAGYYYQGGMGTTFANLGEFDSAKKAHKFLRLYKEHQWKVVEE